MTPQQRDNIFKKLEAEEAHIRCTKGKDYSGEMDVLANFKETAKRSGVSKYTVWHVFFAKHMDSIENAIRNSKGDLPKLASESLRSRINDARNYLGLLECMHCEDVGEVDHQAETVCCHSPEEKDECTFCTPPGPGLPE